MDNYALFLYIGAIMAIIIIGRIFIFPIKKIVKLVINSIIGAGLLYVLNVMGASFGFHIGINWITMSITGLFGVPGVILMVVLKFL